MGRTRIELLSSGDIELFEDVAVPLNFAVADIRTPDKRDAHYSKTIKVPATKGNNIRFGNIFDINLSDGTYNPNRKAECTLYIDDVPQIKGFLKINSIEINDRNDMVYNCIITGNINNLFQELGDSELSDLDLSSFNHILNKSNQIASFTNTYVNGYCYPLIDYGFDSNYNNWDVEHIMPATFVKTLIDKIFSSQGYTYNSTFFDGNIFKKLIIPCTGDNFKYTNAQVEERLFEAGISAQQTSAASNSPSVKINFNTDINDPSNAFNTATSRWSAPYSGYYNLHADINYNTSGTYLSSTVIPTWIEFQKNGSSTAIGSVYNQSVNNIPSTVQLVTNNVYLNAGDYIEVHMRALSASYSVMNWQINISSRFKNTITNATLQSGDTVILSNTLPLKIKQKDFVLDLIRMFNLYVEVDKNNSKRLNIETRDDFYSSGTILDWTYKLDHSNVVEVLPMGDLDFKFFKYSYKDDKDFYNKKYLDSYKINYGNREYEIDSDFLKNTNETKIMFSPTPLVCAVGDDKIISKIIDVDNNNVSKFKPFNVRILYNGGIKTTSSAYTYVDKINGTTSETQYLYAGHLDDPTTPTFDLSFGVPIELYYNTSTYTNANLFNIYHKKYISEITNRDSKIVNAFFYLTPKDIAQLDFRNTFYFEGQLFRLNKIYDYNPIDESVTKCEFIKIKEQSTFTSYTATITNGIKSGFINNNDEVDDKPIISYSLFNQTPTSTLVYGTNNLIGGSLKNSIIVGDQNNIHGGSNIMLLNSSGCTIYDGLQNVTLINSSGTIITESNSIYVNGASISNIGGTWYSQPFSASNFTTDGTGTWTVDSGDIVSNKYNIIGKTFFWNLVLQTSTFASGVIFPRVTIPNSKIIGGIFSQRATISDGTNFYSDVIVNGVAGNNYVELRRMNSSSFSDAANLVEVAFSLTFEIE